MGLQVRRARAQAPIDDKCPVVQEGAVYQKPSAALRHDRWQKVVTIAPSRGDTDPAIEPSIERFEHFHLDIYKRLRPDHSTKKNDVAGAELRWWQDATANTVTRICGERQSEQSERADNEHPQLVLRHVPCPSSTRHRHNLEILKRGGVQKHV